MIIVYPEILLSVAILSLILYGLNVPAFKLSIGSLLIAGMISISPSPQSFLRFSTFQGGVGPDVLFWTGGFMMENS